MLNAKIRTWVCDRGSRGQFFLGDLANKPEASARNRPDQALLLAGIPDCLAHGIDVAGQRGFGHDPSFPHRLQKIVPCHDLFPVSDQEEQQVEHLRSDGDELGASLELAPVGIETIIFK